MGMAPDFPLELSQQILSFASSMGIVMQKADTITQHATAFASDRMASRWPSDYFIFRKLKFRKISESQELVSLEPHQPRFGTQSGFQALTWKKVLFRE
ncbi:hypothetical protein AVEN_77454-1 [Araneus ventricosus]|uniref:Uncharacterized protein n=1 Tax=Araneus ventricosus TaxID=182803 RepID=A0A4Y2N7T9_ARAVE|nr:hypothetical protein AVEN_77454-1 [Araneus ventricosus]